MKSPLIMQETGNKIPDMVEFEFLDETLDINSTHFYHLSVQASLDGLVFSILDTTKNKYIALKAYLNSDKQIDPGKFDWYNSILKSDEFLLKEYKSTGLVYVEERSTLVPDPLFKEQNIGDYTGLNFQFSGHEELFHHKIKKIDTWVIFPVPSKLISGFQGQFPNINIFHQSAPFINRILSERTGNKDRSVFINIYSTMFEIAVTESGNLLLYNCFGYKNTNDLLYYTLNIIKQLKFAAESTRLVLSGKITRQSSLFENIKRYIKNTEFAKPGDRFTYSYTFQNIPAHNHLNLLSLYPCVS